MAIEDLGGSSCFDCKDAFFQGRRRRSAWCAGLVVVVGGEVMMRMLLLVMKNEGWWVCPNHITGDRPEFSHRIRYYYYYFYYYPSL